MKLQNLKNRIPTLLRVEAVGGSRRTAVASQLSHLSSTGLRGGRGRTGRHCTSVQLSLAGP